MSLETSPVRYEVPLRLPKEEILEHGGKVGPFVDRLKEAGEMVEREGRRYVLLDTPENVELGAEVLRVLQNIGDEVSKADRFRYRTDELKSVEIVCSPWRRYVTLWTKGDFAITLKLTGEKYDWTTEVPLEMQTPYGVMIDTPQGFREPIARKLDGGIANVDHPGVAMRQKMLARDIMNVAERVVEARIKSLSSS